MNFCDCETLVKVGNNREEAYQDYINFENGFDEDTKIALSYEQFCTELDKGYSNSEYVQVARLQEDENGVVWYDCDYA